MLADSKASYGGLLLVASLLCIAGCTGETQPSSGNAQLRHRLELPGPLELSRCAAWLDGERLMPGADYSAWLPNNLVEADGDSLGMNPVWEPPESSGMGDVAFAIFSFTLTGPDGEPVIDLSWDDPPPDAGNVDLALGNWMHDRWDWYSGVEVGRLELESMVRYVDSNDHLFVVVAVTGTEPCTLNWVRVGGNLLPEMDLTASPQAGDWPLEVEFDASGSSDPDGSIVGFEWDFDGDGEFELSGAPVQTHVYHSGGARHATVRATDNEGGQRTASRLIDVYSSPGEPVKVADGTVGFDPELAIVDGCPVIICGEDPQSGPNRLVYIRCKNAVGSNWAPPVEVLSQALYGQIVVMDNGRAAVTAVTDDDELVFIRAENTYGTSWEAPVLIAPSGSTRHDLELADGQPAVVFFDTDATGMLYSRATDAEGNSWADPVEVDTVTATTHSQARPVLAIVEALPAVAYIDLTKETTGQLKYARAVDLALSLIHI